MRKLKRGMNKAKLVAGSAVASVVAGVGSVMATENGLTTAAATEMAGVKADVITLGGVMVGIAATMAIAGIIFALIKKR